LTVAKPLAALAVIEPDWPLVRSLSPTCSPLFVSWMSMVTASPGCIINTLLGEGSNVPCVAPSGEGGPIGVPFLVMNAKLAGSTPTVFRQALLLFTPVFWFELKLKMAIAAHHLVVSQLIPGGHCTQLGG
jgi:hypothetical protein